MTATRSGRRIAEAAIPAAGEAPQARSTPPTWSSLSGRIGLDDPGLDQDPEVEREVERRTQLSEPDAPRCSCHTL